MGFWPIRARAGSYLYFNMQEIVTCSNALLLKLMRVEMETTQRQLEERHRPHQPVDRSFQALAGTPVQRQRGGDWRTLSVAYVPKWNVKGFRWEWLELVYYFFYKKNSNRGDFLVEAGNNYEPHQLSQCAHNLYNIWLTKLNVYNRLFHHWITRYDSQPCRIIHS